jgi:hypothetical protein
MCAQFGTRPGGCAAAGGFSVTMEVSAHGLVNFRANLSTKPKKAAIRT